MAEIKRRIRAAVYTRKSHEEGLEQEFNSLDAQREAGELNGPKAGIMRGRKPIEPVVRLS